MSGALSRDLNVSVGGNLVNTDRSNGAESGMEKIILVGASILKGVAAKLVEAGHEVTDLSVPGWSITPDNVSEVVKKLKELGKDKNCVTVLDLFGNSVYRFLEYDGTVSRPYKMGGSYHLAGEVTICDQDIFRNLMDMISPILDAAPGRLRILIPPSPRHLFSPCCLAPSLCSNIGKANHPE